ncbi:hypothetical protein DERP_003541 [Dermatophagoides pteronyssinus]|uniref:Uncharacterized protein n=1 Tax=Dermatophagoides pteronyssinus TaxID=6956 RepID=A0ABQ8JKY3_DERPT|nr:hypothetical protein DERP_003541 [Dermatophagoides pteronyssinus]
MLCNSVEKYKGHQIEIFMTIFSVLVSNSGRLFGGWLMKCLNKNDDYDYDDDDDDGVGKKNDFESPMIRSGGNNGGVGGGGSFREKKKSISFCIAAYTQQKNQ